MTPHDYDPTTDICRGCGLTRRQVEAMHWSLDPYACGSPNHHDLRRQGV